VTTIPETPIFLIGFMTSGKSTVGRLVAGRLGWDFRDLDQVITAPAGMSVAQIFAAEGDKVLVAASTLQKDVRGALKTTGNIEAAKAVGRAIAERAKAKGIAKVAFDRSGFMYHGRVKALAEAAREAGLEF